MFSVYPNSFIVFCRRERLNPLQEKYMKSNKALIARQERAWKRDHCCDIFTYAYQERSIRASKSRAQHSLFPGGFRRVAGLIVGEALSDMIDSRIFPPHEFTAVDRGSDRTTPHSLLIPELTADRRKDPRGVATPHPQRPL